jgi:HEAT repeat protein
MFPVSSARSSISWQFAAILVACLCSGEHGAQSPQLQDGPSLNGFFEALVMHYDPKTLPDYEQVMKVIHQISTMRAEDVTNALPSIITAFRHQDDTVKGYAALAVFGIGERPDGAVLLRPYAKAIGGGLDLPKANLQGFTVQLLAMLKPEPQSETVLLLVAFVRRKDRNPIAQADAISLLLRIAPDNPDLTPALQDFLTRPMTEQTKEAVINDIASSHTENVVAADMLIGALENPSEEVRFQAAQAFGRMPKSMVTRAKPVLQKVLVRPDESPKVKAAAKEALQDGRAD